MYDNLIAEMARKRLTVRSLARLMGVHENTLYRKFEGKVEFKLDEMEMIKRLLQTNATMDYLFER